MERSIGLQSKSRGFYIFHKITESMKVFDIARVLDRPQQCRNLVVKYHNLEIYFLGYKLRCILLTGNTQGFVPVQ